LKILGKTKRSSKSFNIRAHFRNTHYLAKDRLALVSSQELAAIDSRVANMITEGIPLESAALEQSPASGSKGRCADETGSGGLNLQDILNVLNTQSQKCDRQFSDLQTKMHHDIERVTATLESNRRAADARFESLETRMSRMQKGVSTAASSVADSKASSISAHASAAGSATAPGLAPAVPFAAASSGGGHHVPTVPFAPASSGGHLLARPPPYLLVSRRSSILCKLMILGNRATHSSNNSASSNSNGTPFSNLFVIGVIPLAINDRHVMMRTLYPRGFFFAGGAHFIKIRTRESASMNRVRETS
jgi:hypothetical protein